MLVRLAAVLFILVTAQAQAQVAGDPALGRRQFTTSTCAVCHAPDFDKIGPILTGVYGKVAGTNRPDFAYSDALKTSGITWTDETLDKWLTQPAALVPGTKMSFAGIAKEDVRANIIAYLKSPVKGSSGASGGDKE